MEILRQPRDIAGETRLRDRARIAANADLAAIDIGGGWCERHVSMRQSLGHGAAAIQ
jgi:hypothetical protein